MKAVESPLRARASMAACLRSVPVSIKDNIQVKGMPCACGTPDLASFIPEEDGAAVVRLRKAGAVILGKTNVPELCMAGETDNEVYGLTRNPHHLDHTCGGSSGGEAALIASGGSPLGIGSDLGGSIRWPCHCCGIAGLKPTTGRVSRAGNVPPSKGMNHYLAQNGPMARTVVDLDLCMSIISGPDDLDFQTKPVPLGAMAHIDLAGLRGVYFLGTSQYRISDRTSELIQEAVEQIQDVVSSMKEEVPKPFDQSLEIWSRLMGAAGGQGVCALLNSLGTSKPHDLTQKLINLFERFKLNTHDYFKTMAAWDDYRNQMLAYFEPYDFLICPVMANPAPPHGGFDLDELVFTAAFNVTGWPGVAVWIGKSLEGLPIGLQVLARPWREDVALAVAHAVENQVGVMGPVDPHGVLE